VTAEAPPAGSPAARSARHRVLAFRAALGILLVVTLWPRLDPPSIVDSPIDKLAHAAGFGIVAGLAFLAHPAARILSLAGALFLVSAADEAAQSIPGIGRTSDWLDLAANGIGILLAAALAAALRPTRGTGTSVLLRSRRRVAGDLLLARRLNWLHLATAAVLGAAAGAPLAVFVDSWFVRKGPQPWQYGFVGACLGAAVGVHALWEAGVRSRLSRAARERPCLACGTAMAADARECPACSRGRVQADWAPVPDVRGLQEIRACLVPAALALAGLVVTSVAAIALVAGLRLRVGWIGTFDQWFRSLPPDARVLADLALVGLLGAWALGASRERLAAAADRGCERCTACGYDLRATSPASAVGTCHECGSGFVRVGPGAPPGA
jgi:hypothetical protein